MDKIIRREFTGSWVLFWVLAITGMGIPLAIIYLINGTVELVSEVQDAEEFMSQYKSRKKNR